MSDDAIPDDEDAAFQLPMLGLYADLETGFGSVLLPDEFHRAAPAVQQRLLADWQQGLAALQQRLGLPLAAPAVVLADTEAGGLRAESDGV